jgi:Mn-dependent DtxR family transcriptional regulator
MQAAGAGQKITSAALREAMEQSSSLHRSRTHEFLAIMLSVRRPGVTIALNLLEKAGLIQTNRSMIVMIDREGLEESSNGAYGAAEAEFRRLFG